MLVARQQVQPESGQCHLSMQTTDTLTELAMPCLQICARQSNRLQTSRASHIRRTAKFASDPAAPSKAYTRPRRMPPTLPEHGPQPLSRGQRTTLDQPLWLRRRHRLMLVRAFFWRSTLTDVQPQNTLGRSDSPLFLGWAWGGW